MTNATALSAKLRTLGYKPLERQRAREWGGLSVRRTGGIGGDAQVIVHEGWREYHGEKVDAKATADQVSGELKALGYRVDPPTGNGAYASFYVSGSPARQPREDTGKRFTAAALREIPYTYIVEFSHRTAWAVELSGGLTIDEFNPDDLRDDRWSITGTVSGYRPVEGFHSGWIIAVGEDYSGPIRNRGVAMKQWRQWLIRRHEERAEQRFLRAIRQIEIDLDAAVASEKLAGLERVQRRAWDLHGERWAVWRANDRKERVVSREFLKASGPRMRALMERQRVLREQGERLWEDCNVLMSMIGYARAISEEFLEGRAK